MRVLMAVGHAGIYSGGSFQAFYALTAMKRAGLEVAAAWGPDPSGDNPGFQELRRLGIPLHILPIQRRPTWRSVRAFRRLLREFQPEVVECVKSGAQYHAMPAIPGLPAALVFYRGVSRPMDPFMGLKYRWERVDRVIANSRALQRVMARTGRIPAGKMDVVPGEYDPACADPDAVDAAGLKAELGIPDGVPVVTLIGNWALWRGQELLLRAGALLRDRGCRMHILIVGGGVENIAPLVSELGLQGMVTFTGFRRDPERMLKVSDIAVNASTTNESLSGALLNAQVMGVPAVASDLAGNPEVVADGESGLIFPTGDCEALAATLQRMLEMPLEERQRMGSAARQRALKLFSPEMRLEKRLQSYRRALEHRRRRTAADDDSEEEL